MTEGGKIRMQATMNFRMAPQEEDDFVNRIAKKTAAILWPQFKALFWQQNEPPASGDLLDTTAVMRILHVKRSTLYKWKHQGKLQGHVYAGRKLLWPRQEVEKILQGGQDE